MRIAQRHGDIRRAEGRRAQCPASVPGPADGIIGQLNAEDDRVDQAAAPGWCVEEIDVIAASLQIEAEMDARCAVGIVRVEHEVLSGTNQRVEREDKFARTGCAVGDAHVTEVDGLAAVIVEFDQVGEAGSVRNRRDVFRENLVDPDMHISRAHGPGARGGDVRSYARAGRVNEWVVLIVAGVVPAVCGPLARPDNVIVGCVVTGVSGLQAPLSSLHL